MLCKTPTCFNILFYIEDFWFSIGFLKLSIYFLLLSKADSKSLKWNLLIAVESLKVEEY